MIRQPDTIERGGLTASAFAWGEIRYETEHPELSRGMTWDPQTLSKLFAVEKTSLQFKVQVNANYYRQGDINRITEEKSKTFNLKEVPEEFLKEFNRGYSKNKR